MRSDWHYGKYESKSERDNFGKGFLTLILLIVGISVLLYGIVLLISLISSHPEYFEHSLLNRLEQSAPSDFVEKGLVFI